MIHTLHSYLRKCRKHSRLSLADIAFLMDLSDDSSISRFEKGRRSLGLPLLILYHLLFDVPMQTLFEEQKEIMRQLLITRASALIDNLKELDARPLNKGRIAFLESVLTRLNASAPKV